MTSINSVPNEILYKIYKNELSAIWALRSACKGNIPVCNTIVEEIKNKILKDSASENTSLYRFIRQFATRAFDTFADYSSFFHQVAKNAQVFGGSIPETTTLPILLPEDIRKVSAEIEDTALEQVWPRLKEAIVNINALVVIGSDLKANAIRDWLRSNPGPLANVTELNLCDLGIKILPREIGYFTALQELNVSHNQLTVLPPEIGQLTSLHLLQLHFNHLKTLPAEISQLTALRSLYLGQNGITTLPPEIGSLTSLETLVLTSNKLTSLIPEIRQLLQLRELGLGHNQLTTIPAEIEQLSANLQKLHLDGNLFSMIPPQIFQLTALQELDLSENQLTILSQEIDQLIALQILILDDNQISVLPSQIGQLTALRHLHLDNNQLTALPPQIGQLTALQYLHLDNNQLTALPPQIGQLTALQYLHLDNNQLTALPPQIGQLTSLQNLYLNNNFLSALPSEINCLVLKELFLGHNEFTVFPLLTEASFLMASLVNLDLSSNKLKSLPPEIGQFMHLTSLNFSDNQLATLPSELGQLQFLSSLNLKNNPIFPFPFFLFQFRQGYGSVASLYALCSETPFDYSKISTAISALPDFVKDGNNGLYYRIWVISGQPTPSGVGEVWGKNHALDNANILKEAVFRCVKARLATDKQEFQNKCFEYIYRLAGSPVTEDLQWGEHHAYDDPLRFLGAVDLMRKRVVLL